MRVIFEKLTVTAFYGTLRFITVHTTARHWSLSWAKWVQITPSRPVSLSILPQGVNYNDCTGHTDGVKNAVSTSL